MGITIEQIDTHRNGSGGAPFAIVRFTHDGVPMLGILFAEPEHCAVVNRVQAVDTIEFGINSFRGDIFEGELREAVGAWWKAQGHGDHCPYGGPNWPPRKPVGPALTVPALKLCCECANAAMLNNVAVCNLLHDPVTGALQPLATARRYQCGTQRALYWQPKAGA